MGSVVKYVSVNETHFKTYVEVRYLCDNTTYLFCCLEFSLYFSFIHHRMIYLNFTVILLMKLAKILQY